MQENTMTAWQAQAPARSLEEISASIRAHAVNMAMSYIAIGRDLIEAKAQLSQGQWLPWLKSMGFASSTAANYMKLAREVAPESALAALPYSKALALLSLPAGEREGLAREAEDKSAAEIRRLIAERDRAAEAANAESTHVKELQERLSETERALEHAARDMNESDIKAERLERELRDARRHIQEMQTAQPRETVVEIETAPADYEALKRAATLADQNMADALQAAQAAEKRAREAEDALARMEMSAGPAHAPEGIEALSEAVNAFIGATQLMQVNPGPLAARKLDFDVIIRRLSRHVIELQSAVENADFEGVGCVV